MTNPATKAFNVIWINAGRLCYSLGVPAAEVEGTLSYLTGLGFKPWVECQPVAPTFARS